MRHFSWYRRQKAHIWPFLCFFAGLMFCVNLFIIPQKLYWHIASELQIHYKKPHKKWVSKKKDTVICARFSWLWARDQMRQSNFKKFFFQIWTYNIPIGNFMLNKSLKRTHVWKWSRKKLFVYICHIYMLDVKYLVFFHRSEVDIRLWLRRPEKICSTTFLEGYPMVF